MQGWELIALAVALNLMTAALVWLTARSGPRESHMPLRLDWDDLA